MKRLINLKNLLLFVLAAVLLSLMLFKLFGNDIWMHLRSGQLMIEQRVFPTRDPFTFSRPGTQWIAHESLSQILFYLIYLLGGINGLVVLRVIVLTAVFAVCWLLVDREKNDHLLLATWFIFAAILARDRFFLRPHLFSFLTHVISLALLYRYRERQNSTYLIWLIFLELFWTNLHGATAFLGMFLPLVFGIGWFLESWLWPRENQGLNIRLFLAVIVIIFLASLVNPYGYKIYQISFGSYSTGIYRQAIREWAPPSDPGLLSLLALFFICQLALIINSVYRRRRGLTELLFLVAYGYLALSSVRFVSLLVFATLPGTVFLMQQLKVPQDKKVVNLAKAALLILIGGFAISSVIRQHSFQFGLGLDERKVPVKATAFLLENDLPDEVFNTFYFGGYLIWKAYPRYRVFIDGRQIGEIPLFKEYLSFFEAGQAWQKVAAKYDFKVAVIAYPQYQEAGEIAAKRLDKTLPASQWALVFFDDVAMVFVKRIPSLSSFIALHEFKLLKPHAPDFSYLTAQERSSDAEKRLEAELLKALRISPKDFKSNYFAGLYLLSKAAYPKAIEHLQTATKRQPRHLPARNNLALAYLYNGDEEKAVATFKELLRINPQDAVGWNNLGKLYLNRNEAKMAIKCFLKAININGQLLDARYSLAQALEINNQINKAKKAYEEYIKLAKNQPQEKEWLPEAEESLKRLSQSK